MPHITIIGIMNNVISTPCSICGRYMCDHLMNWESIMDNKWKCPGCNQWISPVAQQWYPYSDEQYWHKVCVDRVLGTFKPDVVDIMQVTAIKETGEALAEPCHDHDCSLCANKDVHPTVAPCIQCHHNLDALLAGNRGMCFFIEGIPF